MNVYNFNKVTVYIHCILYKSPKDIFAADIMHRKKGMESYLSQFKRDVQLLLDADRDNDNDLSSHNDLQKKLTQ